MPIYEILRMRRKYLRPVTCHLRNRRLMTMDNCQRAGDWRPVGTSLQ